MTSTTQSEECLEELSLRILGYAVEYAPQVAQGLRRTSELFRAGEVERANDLYAQVLDALSVLVFTVTSSAGHLGSEAEALQVVENALAPWLPALEEAQRRQDWVCVADYLEHEVAAVVDGWPFAIAGVINGREESSQ